MAIKPILFSTSMVQAILEDRKTKTRRAIKPQPELKENSGYNTKGAAYGIGFSQRETDHNFISCVSKIQKGDILWVRETTRICAWDLENGVMAFDYKASPELINTPWNLMQEPWFEQEVIKIADELSAKGINPDKNGHYNWEPGKSPLKWKPSIHMPKIACRIFLEVTNVRVERLQDISESEAIAEGVLKHSDFGSTGYILYTEPEAAYTDIDAVYSFESLWESINGKESWKVNPFVWVYEFKQVSKPKNF